MKKSIIILFALCLLLCSCNAANAKTLASVASSATTLTQELETVRNSGGTVTADELFALDTVQELNTTFVLWSSEYKLAIAHPLTKEGKMINYDGYDYEGFITLMKATVLDDGSEYEVLYTVADKDDNGTVVTPSMVVRAENTATGEVFYDDSIFEDAEITPVQPETETE